MAVRTLTRPAATAATAHPRTRLGLRRRLALTLILGVAVLLVVMVYAVGTGPVPIAPDRVLAATARVLGFPVEVTAAEKAVVGAIRLPRVLVGSLVGAALSVAGVAMQGTFRNPLAEPGVVGVSAGGALGAVTAIYFGLARSGAWTVPAFAFVGSLLCLGIVFAVSSRARGSAATTMLLVGIGLNAFLGALVSIMIATAKSEEDLRSITFWLQGSLDARTWHHVALAAAPILLGCLLLLTTGRELNLMALGDDQGRASGVDVARSRTLILVVAALVTATAVAVSGTIAFVGLVVPHILRLILGPDHRVLLPASMLGGAAFLVLADTAARMLVSPITLQVGVITALIGAPVLVITVLRGRSGLR